MFYAPLTQMTQLTDWFTRFLTAAQRTFEILDTSPQIMLAENPKRLTEPQGAVSFRNVTFGYSRHEPVIKNVSLEIKPAERIGIVGKSGSGKTTLINLLARFYDVDEGVVLVDGADVRDIEARDLNRTVGIVLQEPFLFRGTIYENITYGRHDATPEQVLTASKAANAHNFIIRHALGYDTYIGERGAGLSGGERQRISIARALLYDPENPRPRRGHQQRGHGERAAHPGGARARDAGPHDDRHRPSAQHAEELRPHHRRGRGPHHRAGDARGTAGDRRDVLSAGEDPDRAFARAERGPGRGQRQEVSFAVGRVVQEGAAGVATPPEIKNMDAECAPTGLDPTRTRFLTPDMCRIHLGNLGALHVTVLNEDIYGGVYAAYAFPVAYPGGYISLLQSVGEQEVEVGIIRDLDAFPPPAQELVRQALARRYFIHTITAIREVGWKYGLVAFEVETDKGPSSFYMRWSQDRAVDYGQRGKVLISLENNRYLIPDLDKLTPSERTEFQRYIYW